MKKIYIYAGLGLLFAACSTDAIMNEPIETNKIEQTQHVDILVDLIETIEKSCLQTSYKDEEELLRYVETIAFLQTAFASLLEVNYQTPTVEEVLYLASTDVEELLKGMNYSGKAKDYLYKRFVNQESWNISPSIDDDLVVEEKRLLLVLESISKDEDWNNDVRQIAFAYGYQSSKANAVILAVAVGQLNKIEKR